MAKFFKKESGETPSAGGADKKRQQLLLLVFLLVVGGFGYLYFFTGLIRQPEPAAAPPVQPAQVKQAMPPRPEAGTAQPAPPAQAPADVKATPAPAEKAPPAPAVAPVKTAAPPSPGPAQAKGEPAKPAPPVAGAEAAKPAAKANTGKEGAKAQPAKATAKAEAPAKAAGVAPVANKEAAKAPVAATPAKKEKDGKKEVAARTEPAGQGSSKVVTKKVRPAGKGGRYALLLGDFVNDENFLSVKSRLAKMGVSSVAQKNVKRTAPMHRLYFTEADNRGAAEAELQKLKKFTSDSFILNENGRFVVYAGSYFSEKRAVAEKQKLGSKGVQVSMKKTRALIPMVELTAGPFTSQAAADKELKRLRKKGISARSARIS